MNKPLDSIRLELISGTKETTELVKIAYKGIEKLEKENKQAFSQDLKETKRKFRQEKEENRETFNKPRFLRTNKEMLEKLLQVVFTSSILNKAIPRILPSVKRVLKKIINQSSWRNLFFLSLMNSSFFQFLQTIVPKISLIFSILNIFLNRENWLPQKNKNEQKSAKNLKETKKLEKENRQAFYQNLKKIKNRFRQRKNKNKNDFKERKKRIEVIKKDLFNIRNFIGNYRRGIKYRRIISKFRFKK